MDVFMFLVILFLTHTATESAELFGPFDWSLSEKTITPDNPYCFDKDPANAVVAFDGATIITPTTHCSACFGLWKDAGRDEYCIFFIPGTGESLDYDKANQYLFPVVATDGTAVRGSATVTLQILKNTPPYFTQSTLTGAVTVDVDALVDDFVMVIPVNDLEEAFGDLIGTFNVSSFSSFFYSKNGDLYVAKDLNFLCADSLDLNIWISDGFNPAVGPFVLTITIDRGGNSYKPEMTTKNINKNVNENTKTDFLYFTGDVAATGSCTRSADPVSMQSTYLFVCNRADPYMIQVLEADFETDPSVNFTIIYNDGYCDSDPFWININWVDQPEQPQLSATPTEYTVDEGYVLLDPVFIITDEDIGDVHKYSIANDPTGKFNIIEETGHLFTPDYYSLNGAASQTILLDVLVTDSANLQTNTVQLTINIVDINDNRPVLNAYTSTYSLADCSTLGIITTLTAQDADAGLNGQFDFIPDNSQSMILTTNGEVWLKAQPIDGNIDILTIRIQDRGTPSLTSIDYTISVVGTACPVTGGGTVTINTATVNTGSAATPAPTGATTPPTITTTATPVAAASTNIFDDPWNIALVTLGAVVFVLIVALSIYGIYRCCKKDAASRPPKKNNVTPTKVPVTPQPIYEKPTKGPTTPPKGRITPTKGPSTPPKGRITPSDKLKSDRLNDAESGVYSIYSNDDIRPGVSASGIKPSIRAETSSPSPRFSRLGSPDRVSLTGSIYDDPYFNATVVGQPRELNSNFLNGDFRSDLLTPTKTKSYPAPVSF